MELCPAHPSSDTHQTLLTYLPPPPQPILKMFICIFAKILTRWQDMMVEMVAYPRYRILLVEDACADRDPLVKSTNHTISM